MAKKVKLLPEEIVNKIAAGEIIERPASVVKELMENSVDAKATSIKVEIKDGGKKLIKVIDNGEGMERDDLFLAFERHATSKIYKKEDLFKISTLGFRGEALPSIASVSKVKARAKTKDSDTGFEITIEGGKVKNLTEVSMNKGFIIEVKDLFFNVPVRKKFLKKSDTEYFHIENIFKKFVFVYPEIEFSLYKNGRRKLFFPKTNKLINRIYDIYKDEISENLIPFKVEHEDIFIEGFLSPPDITFLNPKEINFFVNGRYVRDKIILSAIKDAYSGKIEQGKYPLAIIYLNIPYDKVDVNVHPAKFEVKFAEPQKIYNLIKNSIATLFAENVYYYNKKLEKEDISSFEKLKNKLKESVEKYFIKENEEKEEFEPIYEEVVKSKEDLFEEKGFFTKLNYIGTLFSSIIVLEDEEKVYFIDQHAAHERINFEKLKNQIKNNRIEIKKFLIPDILELPERLKPLLESYYDKLKDFGLIIEKFDNDTYVIKGIPSILGDIDFKDFIIELLYELDEIGNSIKDEMIKDKILSSIACKSSIKANVPLDEKSIKVLLKNLDETPNIKTCPHGRPIVKEFKKEEIFKWFKRS